MKNSKRKSPSGKNNTTAKSAAGNSIRKIECNLGERRMDLEDLNDNL